MTKCNGDIGAVVGVSGANVGKTIAVGLKEAFFGSTGAVDGDIVFGGIGALVGRAGARVCVN